MHGLAYKINLGVWGRVFAVPSCVAERLKLINGEHLKVLLYILNSSGRAVEPEEIAEMTGVGVGTVSDALIFWENMEIISSIDGEIMPAEGTPEPVAVPVSAEEPVTSAPKKDAVIRAKLTSDTQFPPKEIAAAVNADESFRYLCQFFEKLSGRPTKHSERNLLMVITEEIGLKTEVAIMLIEYCFSVDKATPAYMKSVAMDWHECGIDSVIKADERIQQLKTRNTLENKLRVKFRMQSAFSAKQKEYINGWAELEIPDELIDEAYDKTLNQTGKLSFGYMDKILRSWLEKGYLTVEQTRQEKSPGVSSAISTGSSFDIDSLEQSAYERYRKKE